MSTEELVRAITATRAVLSGVKPDDLDRPTPCPSWDVHALINHIIGGPRWAAAVMVGREPVTEDYGAGDYLASYDETTAEALAAFAVPGALEKTVSLPFGDFTGAWLLLGTTVDQLTHGWDLARATGQSTDLDAEVAQEVLVQVMGQIPDAFRGDEGMAWFGPPQKVPTDATAADRLAAYLGRRV